MDALLQELRAVFEAEFRDHLQASRALLSLPTLERTALSELFRRLHSLKGAARAVDHGPIEAIAHRLESDFQSVLSGGSVPDTAFVQHVERGLDALEGAMEARPDPGPAHRADGDDTPDAGGYVQVPIARLDALILGMHRLAAAIERRDALWSAVDRVFDSPSTAGAQEVAVRSIHDGFRALDGMRADIGGGIDRALADLRSEIQSIALVQAGAVFSGLAGMARQIARDYLRQDGHRIDEAMPDGIVVRLSGMDVRADRPVLQALRDPVIQLLRNAIVHGGERWASARRAGRAAQLVITLSVRLAGNRLVVEVADDGRGPDLAAIARQGVRQGVLAPDEQPDETRLLACVFEPGFSTRGEADELAGRGFGLSIVAESVRVLHGSVRMRPCSPGTAVSIAVPLARRARTILLVEAGGQMLGLDGGAVERLLRLGPDAFFDTAEGALVTVPGLEGDEGSEGVPERLVPVLPLDAFLGATTPHAHKAPGAMRVVVCLRGTETGGPRALVVDAACEVRDMVVGDSAIPGLDTDLTPDLGWVREDWPVLVLDAAVLVRRWDQAARWRGAAGSPLGDVGMVAPERPVVLVVDDSITTRTLEKTILLAHGYDVRVATDGLDALDILRREGRAITIVITDVEMPRMDGFALLAAIRDDPALAAIPVVIMTSRNEEDDIRRGLEGGARAYITKQAFEQGELIATLESLL
ncbi:chemotaxis protein CheA [Ameyamaea chiangmaiensis NBRC 103196]|uniref:histidine kinase n=1 Tax=Ameyamaea chiangmaiensis TaxID=442969 RepID=A0A850PC75_9PROT|nr:response regulator [Ameyamaea chiangmaiensis]MBS4074465.1 response regulator [Ameyamaea chiangmaiensis]NVN41724.1 response regulator [Ameyamaea chiangmaiensis]GBQ72136.1 chemotaxis protein CheA [Ameyamaea chiangmaiensis NBRC 103196]